MARFLPNSAEAHRTRQSYADRASPRSGVACGLDVEVADGEVVDVELLDTAFADGEFADGEGSNGERADGEGSDSEGSKGECAGREGADLGGSGFGGESGLVGWHGWNCMPILGMRDDAGSKTRAYSVALRYTMVS